MWIAELDTRHYTFHAAGETRADAEKAMASTWRKHIRGCPDGYRWKELADDVNYFEIAAGQGLRDYEPIGGRA